MVIIFLCSFFSFQYALLSQTTAKKEISSTITLDTITVLYKISPLFLGNIVTQSHLEFKNVQELSFTQKK